LSRVKGGAAARKRHKKVLSLTKGQRGSRSTLYKRAHEAMIKSLAYSYQHRRERKGDFRRLWIMRINAAARQAGLSYSQFISGLKKANVHVDRKMLADMAIQGDPAFGALVELAKTA
jgi:large subunit ribosomal protein L20